MQTNTETFGTAFNCMDGRCQEAVRAYVQQTYGVVWVDAITEPGMDGILAGKALLEEQPKSILEWIRRKAEISAKGHRSAHAVVVGHTQCAGNDVSDPSHLADIRKAVETVQSWHLFGTVVGLLAVPEGDRWCLRNI